MSCSAHVEEETRILKSSAFALLKCTYFFDKDNRVNLDKKSLIEKSLSAHLTTSPTDKGYSAEYFFFFFFSLKRQLL